MRRRVHIDRLELDIRGIAPADAEAVARLLGAALARTVARRRLAATAVDRLDAGRIETSHRRDPHALAERMAGHIVQRLGDKS
jgi:hypothetical protein